MEENISLQHVQVPNDLIRTVGISPADVVVYGVLKSFDGPDGCFPSLKSISNRCNVSINTVRKCVNNLISSNWITVQHNGSGSKTYYTFIKNIEFEPFSYQFLLDETIPFTEKSYLMCLQHSMFKKSTSEGVLVMSSEDISELTGLSPTTIYRCEKSLKEKGILTVKKSNAKDVITGCKQEVRIFDFSKYFQAIAYILRHQQDQLNKHDQEIKDVQKDITEIKKVIEMRADTVHNRQFEKDVIQAISLLSKQVAELKKKNK